MAESPLKDSNSSDTYQDVTFPKVELDVEDSNEVTAGNYFYEASSDGEFIGPDPTPFKSEAFNFSLDAETSSRDLWKKDVDGFRYQSSDSEVQKTPNLISNVNADVELLNEAHFSLKVITESWNTALKNVSVVHSSSSTVLIFSCIFCSFTTDCVDTIKLHLIMGHLECRSLVGGCIPCQHCNASFDSNTSYKMHLVDVHTSSKAVACPFCPGTVQEDSFRQHVFVEHFTNPLASSLLTKETPTIAESTQLGPRNCKITEKTRLRNQTVSHAARRQNKAGLRGSLKLQSCSVKPPKPRETELGASKHQLELLESTEACPTDEPESLTTEPTSSLELAVSHATKPTGPLKLAVFHTTKSTGSLKQAVSSATKATSPLELTVSHATKPTGPLELAVSHATKPTGPLEVAVSHATKPTGPLELAVSHATKPTGPLELAVSHATKPTDSLKLAVACATKHAGVFEKTVSPAFKPDFKFPSTFSNATKPAVEIRQHALQVSQLARQIQCSHTQSDASCGKASLQAVEQKSRSNSDCIAGVNMCTKGQVYKKKGKLKSSEVHLQPHTRSKSRKSYFDSHTIRIALQEKQKSSEAGLQKCLFCPYVNSSKNTDFSKMRRHLLTHLARARSVAGNIVCPHCKAHFDCDYSFQGHLTRVHDKDDQHCCRLCSDVFATGNKKRTHVMTFHSSVLEPEIFLVHPAKKRFKKSNSTVATSDSFPNELVELKSSEIIVHSISKKKYFDAHTIRMALRDHLETPKKDWQKCIFCPHVHASKKIEFNKMRRHLVTHLACVRTVAGNIVCPHCRTNFDDDWLFQRHLTQVHKKVDHHCCRLCSVVCVTAEQMRSHMNDFHGSALEPEILLMNPRSMPKKFNATVPTEKSDDSQSSNDPMTLSTPEEISEDTLGDNGLANAGCPVYDHSNSCSIERNSEESENAVTISNVDSLRSTTSKETFRESSESNHSVDKDCCLMNYSTLLNMTQKNTLEEISSERSNNIECNQHIWEGNTGNPQPDSFEECELCPRVREGSFCTCKSNIRRPRSNGTMNNPFAPFVVHIAEVNSKRTDELCISGIGKEDQPIVEITLTDMDPDCRTNENCRVKKSQLKTGPYTPRRHTTDSNLLTEHLPSFNAENPATGDNTTQVKAPANKQLYNSTSIQRVGKVTPVDSDASIEHGHLSSETDSQQSLEWYDVTVCLNDDIILPSITSETAPSENSIHEAVCEPRSVYKMFQADVGDRNNVDPEAVCEPRSVYKMFQADVGDRNNVDPEAVCEPRSVYKMFPADVGDRNNVDPESVYEPRSVYKMFPADVGNLNNVDPESVLNNYSKTQLLPPNHSTMSCRNLASQCTETFKECGNQYVKKQLQCEPDLKKSNIGVPIQIYIAAGEMRNGLTKHFTCNSEHLRLRKCPFCPYINRSPKLDVHKLKVHIIGHLAAEPSSNGTLNCPHCNSSFPTEKSYRDHLTNMHRRRQGGHYCRFCPFQSKVLSQLSSHLIRVHALALVPEIVYVKRTGRNTSDFTCNNKSEGKCESAKVLSSRGIYCLRSQSDILQSCPHCNWSGSSLKEFKSHLREYHTKGSNRYFCSKCPFTDDDLVIFERHLFSHSDKDCAGTSLDSLNEDDRSWSDSDNINKRRKTARISRSSPQFTPCLQVPAKLRMKRSRIGRSSPKYTPCQVPAKLQMKSARIGRSSPKYTPCQVPAKLQMKSARIGRSSPKYTPCQVPAKRQMKSARIGRSSPKYTPCQVPAKLQMKSARIGRSSPKFAPLPQASVRRFKSLSDTSRNLCFSRQKLNDDIGGFETVEENRSFVEITLTDMDLVCRTDEDFSVKESQVITGPYTPAHETGSHLRTDARQSCTDEIQATNTDDQVKTTDNKKVSNSTARLIRNAAQGHEFIQRVTKVPRADSAAGVDHFSLSIKEDCQQSMEACDLTVSTNNGVYVPSKTLETTHNEHSAHESVPELLTRSKKSKHAKNSKWKRSLNFVTRDTLFGALQSACDQMYRLSNDRLACQYCETSFLSGHQLFNHLVKYHLSILDGNGCIVCPYCGEEFFQNELYHKHVKSSHDSSHKKSCPQCAFQSSSLSTLFYHSIKMHFPELKTSSPLDVVMPSEQNINHIVKTCSVQSKGRSALKIGSDLLEKINGSVYDIQTDVGEQNNVTLESVGLNIDTEPQILPQDPSAVSLNSSANQNTMSFDECGNQYVNKELLLLAVHNEYIKNKNNSQANYFECQFCHSPSLTIQGLFHHLVVFHFTLLKGKGSTIQCPLCNEEFDQEEQFQDHLKLICLPRRMLSCPQCSLSTRDLKDWCNHFVVYHFKELQYIPDLGGSNNVVSEVSHKTYLIAEEMRNVLKKYLMNNTGRPRECPFCDYIYQGQKKDTYALKVHIVGHLATLPSPDGDLKCPHCEGSFLTEKSFRNHMTKMHRRRQGGFYCRFCSFQSVGSGQLHSHLFRVHALTLVPEIQLKKSILYTSPSSDYTTSNKIFLKRERTRAMSPSKRQSRLQTVRNNKRKLTCTHSNQSEGEMSEPRRQLTDLQQSCPHCSWSGSNQKKFKSHLRECHTDGNDQHFCSKCPFTADDRVVFERHLFSHSTKDCADTLEDASNDEDESWSDSENIKKRHKKAHISRFSSKSVLCRKASARLFKPADDMVTEANHEDLKNPANQPSDDNDCFPSNSTSDNFDIDAAANSIISKKHVDNLSTVTVSEESTDPFPQNSLTPNKYFAEKKYEPSSHTQVKSLVFGDTDFGFLMSCPKCSFTATDITFYEEHLRNNHKFKI